MHELFYENQGTNTYLVYKLAADDEIDSMSLGMLTNNKIPGIAATVFMQADNQKYIKYNVSAKISVKQFFAGAVNKKRLLGVFRGVVDAMSEAEEYMIDGNMILLDLDYIYADVSTCETVLICVPVVREECEPMDLGMFFKNIMFSTQFDQTENCDHVAKIINYLNSAPLFSLSEFKKLLDNMEESKEVSEAKAPKTEAIETQHKEQPISNMQKEISEQIAVQSNISEKNSPVSPVFPENKILKMPSNTETEPRQENVQPQKPMSMFYLLQHYNKENAATYKAQKEEKKRMAANAKPEKAAKKKTKKKKEAPNTEFGFAVPGQQSIQPQGINPSMPVTNKKNMPAPPPMVRNGETVTQSGNKIQQMEVSNTKESRIMPTETVQQMVYAATESQGQKMNFGETTVLNAGMTGETTVLNNSELSKKVTAYLIRAKNNEKIMLSKPQFRVGKEKSYVDYFIGDNTAISRSHAVFVIREGSYYVMDTNSTNHTFVNGKMLQSNVETKIEPGDRIRLANEDFELKLS